MKTLYKKFVKFLCVIACGVMLTVSCTDYLNMAPEVNLTEKDVFGTFQKYQGFVEDLYQCVVDLTLTGSVAEGGWNFGLDEGIMTDTRQLSYYFEKGNYWAWTQTNYSPYSGRVQSPDNGGSGGGRGYWRSGWYGIRKANIAIRNIGMFQMDGSALAQQQHDVLLGQAYFFRAYLHFEILRHWGHIAYIDTVWNASDLIEPNPLPYQECAARIDADLDKAIALLPESWDAVDFLPGQATSSKNAGRVTKGSAWAIKGMNALYAGSPLMATDAASPNNPDSTKFDVEQMKKAAAAYGEVINLSNASIAGGNNKGGYDLELWQDYHKNFWNSDGTAINGKEVVWTYPNTQTKRWNYADMYVDAFAWGTYFGPTQNYVENFGMVNGLPLADAASGYNPNDPFKNRDPRYYYNIMSDGDRLVVNPTASWTNYTNVEFFIGGLSRSSNCSLTGYGYHKFYSIYWNPSDNKWSSNTSMYDVPLVRLAGVLLEYAEAVNEAYGPGGKAPNCSLSAIDAVNKVRSRVMCPPYTNSYPELYDIQKGGTALPNVAAKYTASKELFREIIRKERAVELAFEGKRWDDARRWGVASSLKYREKYELQFDKGHTYFKKVLYSTSVFEPKHWWLPFQTQQVALYPAFKQNPGW